MRLRVAERVRGGAELCTCPLSGESRIACQVKSSQVKPGHVKSSQVKPSQAKSSWWRVEGGLRDDDHMGRWAGEHEGSHGDPGLVSTRLTYGPELAGSIQVWYQRGAKGLSKQLLERRRVHTCTTHRAWTHECTECMRTGECMHCV